MRTVLYTSCTRVFGSAQRPVDYGTDNLDQRRLFDSLDRAANTRRAILIYGER